MLRRILLVCLLGTALSLCHGRVARAQRGVYPPPFSPWLELFRRDPGPLGPYLSNVRPVLELQRQLARQSVDLRRQGSQIRAIRQQITTQTVRDVLAAPTGQGATFMNYSHFYTMPQTTGRQRRQAPRPSYGSFGGYSSFGGFGY